MSYLTVALSKGRLARETLKLFASCGLAHEEINEHSRKLIFVDEEKKMKYFLAKSSDVPTYVEYGAADVGISGGDVLMEEGRNLCEVLDLGIGKCRIVVAGFAEMQEKFEHLNNIRVSTKYPNIAKRHFYRKHRQAEIVYLDGSVELGPIVGLSDVIVDIVESGATLKENGLVVFEDICSISARLVVNRVSMKMEYERITDLIKQLKATCYKE